MNLLKDNNNNNYNHNQQLELIPSDERRRQIASQKNAREFDVETTK